MSPNRVSAFKMANISAVKMELPLGSESLLSIFKSGTTNAAPVLPSACTEPSVLVWR